MRLLLMLAAAGLYAQDAREILKRALERDVRNYDTLNTYTYRQKTAVTTFEKDGRAKKVETKVEDVFHVDGTRIEVLVEEDGKPLSPKDREKEQRKFDREVAKIKNESPAQRAKRRGETAKDKKEEAEARREVLDAYNPVIEGEETVNDRACWRLRGDPRPGFKGKGRRASQLEKMKGRAWVDKETYEWVKLDLDTTDTISFGLFLFRLQKGAKVGVQQTLVNKEVWLPKAVDVRAEARLLGRMMRIGVEIAFFDYRKFSTDTQVTFGEPVEAK